METSKSNMANETDQNNLGISRCSTPMIAPTTDTVTDVNLNDKLNVYPPDNLDARLLTSSSTQDSRNDNDDHNIPEVELYAVRFVADVVDHVTGMCDVYRTPGDGHQNRFDTRTDIGSDYLQYRETLLIVVAEISERHRLEFSEMTSKLLADIGGQVVRQEDVPTVIQKVFDSVVRELLADGQCNWGRVATVYAFASSLGRRWIDYGGTVVVDGQGGDGVNQLRTSLIDELKAAIGTVIVDRLSTWIKANGGWKEFDRFFKTRIPRSSSAPEVLSWRSLLIAAAGIGAVAVIVSSLAHQR